MRLARDSLALLGTLILCGQVVAEGKVFEFNIFDFNGGAGGTRAFFEDYTHVSQCSVEIEESAIAPDVFIDINSPDFLRLDCTIVGNHDTYTFSYGEEVAKPDYWRGSVVAPNGSPWQLGLLFDDEGKPLRFDSPQFSTANLVGFYDTEGRETPDGDLNITGAPFFDPIVEDVFDIPAAVLLEPATIFGVEQPLGYITSSDRIPFGSEAALLNGSFGFSEGFYDTEGNFFNDGLVLSGYLSFDETLSPTRVRITQAVYQEKEPKFNLVDKRTTAIIVDKGPLFIDGIIKLTVTDVTDQNNQHDVFVTNEPFFDIGSYDNQFIFFCNEIVNYCNLKAGRTYEISISIDGGDTFYRKAQIVNVIEILPLAVSYLFLKPEFCRIPGGIFDAECKIPESEIRDQVGTVNQYLQEMFPLPDDGLSLIDSFGEAGKSLVSTDTRGSDFGVLVPPAESSCIPEGSSEILINTALVVDYTIAEKKFYNESPNWKRGVVFVPSNYFANYIPEAPKVRGLDLGSSNKRSIVFALINANPIVPVHELGHTYDLPVNGTQSTNFREEYEVDASCGADPKKSGPITDGFNVYASITGTEPFISRHRSFMGSEVGQPDFWVTTENWNRLVENIPSSEFDPDLIVFDISIDESRGVASFGSAFATVGNENDMSSGDYEVVVTAKGGEVIFSGRFDVIREIGLEGLGVVQVASFPTVLAIPFPLEAESVIAKDTSGAVIDGFDPVSKIIDDGVSELIRVCEFSDTFESSLMSKAEHFGVALSNGNATEALNVVNILEQWLIVEPTEQCSYSQTIFGAKENLARSLRTTKERVSARLNPTLLPGDLNGDGQLDQADYGLIRTTLGKCEGQAGFIGAADLNLDGCVGYDDYRQWIVLYRNR